MMNTLALLIGGNQGDRLALIEQATELIRVRIGSVVAFSRVYETEPWGKFEVESPELKVESFLNRALVVDTELSALEVLHRTQGIEMELGRIRYAPTQQRDALPCKGELPEGQKDARLYHSRTMDIDIIFFNDDVIDTAELTVPHPRMHMRRFVLEPLCEIMPDYRHPVLGKTVRELFMAVREK